MSILSLQQVNMGGGALSIKTAFFYLCILKIKGVTNNG